MTAEQKFAYKVKLEKQWRMATGKGIEKATESQIKSLKNMAYASQTVLDDAYIESLDKFQASELYKHLQSKIENYKNQRIEKFELEDELQRGNVADLKKGTAPSMTPSNTYMNEIATDPDDLKKLERTMERLEKHGVDPDLYDSDIIDRFEKGELTRRQVAEFMSDTSKLMDDNVTSEGTSGLVSVKSGISEQKIKNLETALKNLERTKPDVVSTIRERLAKTPIKDEVMYKAELKNVFSELS
jgi:hypothetical protein